MQKAIGQEHRPGLCAVVGLPILQQAGPERAVLQEQNAPALVAGPPDVRHPLYHLGQASQDHENPKCGARPERQQSGSKGRGGRCHTLSGAKRAVGCKQITHICFGVGVSGVPKSHGAD